MGIPKQNKKKQAAVIGKKNIAKISTEKELISTWGKQFKTAIKKGIKPEKDLFKGMTNDFDLNEW